MRNTLRTFTLLAALTAIFLGIGYSLAGPGGMLIAFGLAMAMNLFSYWNSDKIVLRMYRAQPVDASHPDARVRAYAEDVLEMASRAGIPAPKVYIIDQDQPNAFATGRNPDHAAVAATRGLLQMLDRREIRGVMAHELAHVVLGHLDLPDGGNTEALELEADALAQPDEQDNALVALPILSDGNGLQHFWDGFDLPVDFWPGRRKKGKNRPRALQPGPVILPKSNCVNAPA